MFNIWDWKKKPPEIKGILVFKKSNMPPWGKKMYGIELENGEVWYLWGTRNLVSELAPLPFQTKVKIRWLGLGFDKPDDKFKSVMFDVQVIELGKLSSRAAAAKKSLDKLSHKKYNF